jgi:uncharacterized protein (TIGR03437 family)
MSLFRHVCKAVVLVAVLFPACFAQTCLPFYGTDAAHPNGLLLRLAPAKQPAQNTSSTYIWPIPGYGQALWDSTAGVHEVLSASVIGALSTEFAGCVPNSTQAPSTPISVPYYYSGLAYGGTLMAAADVNGDGLPDVVVAVPGTNQISVYLGNKDGTVGAPIVSKFGNATAKIVAIALADLNLDRKIDVLAVDQANNVVYVGLGRGDGNFTPSGTVSTGHAPSAITLGDFNNDGIPDFAVANSADNTVSAIRGFGDGTFLPPVVVNVGKNPSSVLAIDANGDGNMDLFVADAGSNDIAFLIGYGTGGFQNPVYTSVPAAPTYLASADFNNDGHPDIVALAGDVNAVMLLLGSPTGAIHLTGSYLVPNLTASLVINDFNGDGYLDLLVPDTDSGSPVLLQGRGDGTLIAPPAYLNTTGAIFVTTADINNDGNADLVVTGSNGPASAVSILYGNGKGVFPNVVTVPVSGHPDTVAVGDFNRDGHLDLAVSGTQLNILYGQPSGAFIAGPQYANLTPSVAMDLNKDGIIDLAGPFNGNLGVMLGNGDGTFKPAVSYTVGVNPKSAVAAGFRNKSTLDLAVLNAGSATDPGGVSILPGNGLGSFGSASNIVVGTNPRALAVLDVNGDGKPDLIVATGIPAKNYQISVLLGNGDGTFQAPLNVPLPPGETPNALAVVDLDGDGNPDIVVSDCCSDSSTSYLRGNGDGTFQPPIAFYAGNSPRSIAVGDWNNDGKPDLAFAASPTDAPSQGAVVILTNHLAVTPGIVNTSGASFLPGPIAPASIVAAFGTNLTSGTAAATGDPSSLPVTLANTTVTVKDSLGVPRFAPLYYVSPTQINYLVPPLTALGPATVEVSSPTGVSSAKVTVTPVSPGLFTANSSGLAAASGIQVDGNNQSGFNVEYTDPTSGNVLPVPIYLGPSYEQTYLVLYATGLRNRSSLDSVVVTVGGVYTPALYAGPQSQYPGLDQLNIQIPHSLAGAGSVNIQVTADGIAANPVNVTIQ